VNGELDGLPDDVRAAIERPQLERQARLTRLGATIGALRDEAVKYRNESGIESTWFELEAQYVGIDAMNRHEFETAKYVKPIALGGPLIAEKLNRDDTKATAFVAETRRYVMAGYSKVCEVSLPVDGKPFALKATPVPEMASAADDQTLAQDVTGQPMPGHDGQPVKVQDLAKHAMEVAEKAAEKAATRIADWMVEYKHNAEIRKVVFDGARIGVGVLKGPFPEARKTIVVHKPKPDQSLPDQTVATVTTIEIVEKVKPAARRIDPWNFYPAPGCGEDIHKGPHCFEVDQMLKNELAGLSELEFFIPYAIDKVIEEGPGKIFANNQRDNSRTDQNKKPYEVWHFYGRISREEFTAANETQSASEVVKARDSVFVIVTLVNDTVIRAVLNPLDSGRLPYHVFNWSRREGHWAGVGVTEQCTVPQVILNSATRAMLNNAAKSSGAHVVMDDNAVEPATPNDYRLGVGDKLWLLKKATGADDVRKVFASFEWPNTTPQLMAIIEFALKLFEESTSIPLITQGQSGKTTPDTFSGQQLQDNNANQLLRSVGFNLNDQVTSPFLDQCYEWLLLDEEVPDDEKGDYQVDTSGALAIIEKALNDQFIPQLLVASTNPAYGLNPKLCMENMIRMKRMVPSQFQYTEAETEQMAQQPPPKPPVVEAAEIRAASAEKIAASADQLAATKAKIDTDRDRVYNELMAAREQSARESTMGELALRREIATLQYQTKVAEFALKRDLNLQDAKVELAKTAAQLQAQRDIAGADGKGPEVATPATEPPGRAPNGEAFQR
jgi:hypothetical protein